MLKLLKHKQKNIVLVQFDKRISSDDLAKARAFVSQEFAKDEMLHLINVYHKSTIFEQTDLPFRLAAWVNSHTDFLVSLSSCGLSFSKQLVYNAYLNSLKSDAKRIQEQYDTLADALLFFKIRSLDEFRSYSE